MVEYIKYIGLRLLVAIVFISAMVAINKVLFKNAHANLFDGVKDLIVGDSHFNGLSINGAMHMGQDSEVYYTMLQKVKEVNEISELENVIISYSYLNFSKKYFDDFLLANDVQAFSISKRNYALASVKDQIRQSRYYEQLVKVFARFNFSLNLNYLQSSEDLHKSLPFMWYQGVKTREVNLDQLKKLQEKRKRKLDPNSNRYKKQIAAKIDRLFINEENSIAEINLSYFEEILEYCADNQIKLWLVSTPLENSYEKAIPEYLKSAFKEYTDEVLQSHDNVKFLDYTHKFDDPDFFQDEHHVTTYGAALLSIDIANELKATN